MLSQIFNDLVESFDEDEDTEVFALFSDQSKEGCLNVTWNCDNYFSLKLFLLKMMHPVFLFCHFVTKTKPLFETWKADINSRLVFAGNFS